MTQNKLQIKLVTDTKAKEEIIIDITLDRMGLWKEDLKRILADREGKLSEFSIVHERFMAQPDGSFLKTEEYLFFEQ